VRELSELHMRIRSAAGTSYGPLTKQQVIFSVAKWRTPSGCHPGVPFGPRPGTLWVIALLRPPRATHPATHRMPARLPAPAMVKGTSAEPRTNASKPAAIGWRVARLAPAKPSGFVSLTRQPEHRTAAPDGGTGRRRKTEAPETDILFLARASRRSRAEKAGISVQLPASSNWYLGSFVRGIETSR
jgi:hypothetical protein